ncbi:ATP-dependent RNA helicase DDX18-like isoform X2 [Hyalella azteca]|nr:ATP-dependent RNA helicase DDX18-like isoform X2 [Hyalella azteca]
MIKIARKEAKLKGRMPVILPATPKLCPFVPNFKRNPRGCPVSVLEKVLTKETLNDIKNLNFNKIADIQAIAIPLLAKGTNARIIAEPASGKTLAFLIPVLDRLRRTNFNKENGVGVLVLCPNSGLCEQSRAELHKLVHRSSGDSFTSSVAYGCDDDQTSANVLFCTPASLCHHLQNTPNFSLEKVFMLVLDEFDFLLCHYDQVPHMQTILPKLPKKLQVVMVSATHGKEDAELVALYFGGRKYADVDLSAPRGAGLSPHVTLEYMLCPTHYRLGLLVKALQQSAARKTLVFFTLDATVQLYSRVLAVMGIPNIAYHSGLTREQRTSTHKTFVSVTSGVLLCCDADVLGWHVQNVDCVLQVDPPHNTSVFARRVGFAGRHLAGSAAAGDTNGTPAKDAKVSCLTLLRPEETCYLELLQNDLSVLLNRRIINTGHLPSLLATTHMAVHNTPGLQEAASKAAASYRNNYRRLKPKTMFPAQGLHKVEIEAAFGLVGQIPKAVHTAAENRMQPYLRQLDDWENE